MKTNRKEVRIKGVWEKRLNWEERGRHATKKGRWVKMGRGIHRKKDGGT